MEINESVSAIENLTLIQASELVKALEEKFGVTAAAPVAAAARKYQDALPRGILLSLTEPSDLITDSERGPLHQHLRRQAEHLRRRPVGPFHLLRGDNILHRKPHLLPCCGFDPPARDSISIVRIGCCFSGS